MGADLTSIFCFILALIPTGPQRIDSNLLFSMYGSGHNKRKTFKNILKPFKTVYTGYFLGGHKPGEEMLAIVIRLAPAAVQRCPLEQPILYPHFYEHCFRNCGRLERGTRLMPEMARVGKQALDRYAGSGNDGAVPHIQHELQALNRDRTWNQY